MKKTFIFLLLILPSLIFAQNFEAPNLDKEFAAIDKIENVLLENPNAKVDTLIKDVQKDSEVKIDTSNSSIVKSADKNTQLPSYILGCILSWVGILIVYFVTDNDKSEVIKAAKGAITTVIVGACLYGILIIVAISQSSQTGY